MAVVAVAFLVAGLAQEPQEVWSSDQVQSFIAANEAPPEADPFAPTVSGPFDGQRFRLNFDLQQRRGYSGGPYTWSYEAARQRMTFSISPDGFYGTAWMRGDRLDDVRTFTRLGHKGFILSRTESVEDGGSRSNAYGATVDVTTTRVIETAVVEFANDFGTPRPFNELAPLETEMSVSPEEGRRLSTDVEVVVEGEFKAFDGGYHVICGSDYGEPTIRNPRETIIKTCAAVVDVQRIALQRKSTGELIKAWPR